MTQSDPRITEALRFGFERRGARVDVSSSVDEVIATLDSCTGKVTAPQLIIAGADSPSAALELIAGLRRAVKKGPVHMPILYLGNSITRDEAQAAGASEILPRPAFLRDVVTIARLLASPKRRSKTAFRGDLEDYDGVFYLIRAIASAGRSAVLSMIRGLRRGEIRFYCGEVTSAQVGVLHGLAALHQLLIWTQANFELRHESIVRRQQIPLSRAELLRDSQRFLAEIRAVATSIDTAIKYVPVLEKIEAQPIPGAVREVLQLLDSHRTIADVIEDSPFRLFDTLRMTNRLAELELIEPYEESKSDGLHPALMVDEWQIDGVPKPGVPMAIDDDETPSRSGVLQKLADSELEGSVWSGILPTSLSADTNVSQVVPAAVAVGEIVVAGRTDPDVGDEEDSAGDENDDDSESSDGHSADADPQREGLEVITDARARDELFSTTTARSGADSDPKEAGSDKDSGHAAKAGGATAGSARRKPRRLPSPQFSDYEEEFFRQGVKLESAKPPPVESFDDLDQGYQRQTFWQRLFGRTRRPPTESGATERQAKEPGKAEPADGESAAEADKEAVEAASRKAPGKRGQSGKKSKKR